MSLPVLVILEDVLQAVAAILYALARARKFHSHGARHSASVFG
jgi:hypothetical protein